MAQTDETARRIYKYLISLHSDCNEILRLVEEAGTLSREIKALEEQVISFSNVTSILNLLNLFISFLWFERISE